MQTRINRINRNWQGIFLFFIASLALSEASVGEQPNPQSVAGTPAASSKSNAAPPSTAPTIQSSPANHVATRLSLAKKMATQPLEFYPAADRKNGTRFVGSGAGYSLILKDSSLQLVTRRPIADVPAIENPSRAINGAAPGVRRPHPQMRTESELIEFIGANPNARVEGLNPSESYANFFIGSDPAQWRSHVSGYQRVRYANLYPGIDLVYHSEIHQQLEYDLAVSPGADPSQVRLRVSGDHKAGIGKDGDLELDGPDGILHFRSPVLYQNVQSGKKAIGGGFVQLAENEFGFKVSGYDRAKPLIIDPTITLVYATYVGGRHEDDANDIVIDSSGDSYIVGDSASQDFPISSNAYQTARDDIGTYFYDGVILKFNSSGILLYSTFLGGSINSTGESQANSARCVAVDSSGNAYIGGVTYTSDFPTTANAYAKTAGVGFISKISPDGSTLEYSTYYPAGVTGIMLDAQGQAIITGTAGPGLETSKGAYMPKLTSGQAAFATILDLTKKGAAQLVASTYYGTNSPATNYINTGNIQIGFAVDGESNIWISGQAFTPNLPTTANAYQSSVPSLDPGCDGNGAALNSAAFIAEMSPDLTKLEYATYFSGKKTGPTADDCSEYVADLAFDSAGNLYAAGVTASATFPVTSEAIQKVYPGSAGNQGFTAWVAKFAPNTPAPVWSSYFGGSGGDTFVSADLHGNAVDSAGNVWIVGQTAGGSNFPISSKPYQRTYGGQADGFVSEISPDGKTLLYSTYLGGSGFDLTTGVAIDATNNLYLAGWTGSSDFPVTHDAFQSEYAEGCASGCDGNDMFFAILGSGAIGTVGPTTGGNTGDTTINVSGAGFENGATCELVMGGTVIASIAATVNSAGTSVSCTFALQGVAPGTYDVVIKSPGGATLTDKDAYTVENGGTTVVSVSLSGRSAIRVGTPTTMVLNYSNSGTLDAYMTTVWLVLPGSYTYSIPGVTTPVNNKCTLLSQSPNNVAYNGYQYIPILIPKISGGSAGSIQFTVTAPTAATGQELEVYAETPWFGSLEAATTFLNDVVANPKTASAQCTPDPVNPAIDNCFGFVASAAGQEYAAYLTSLGGVDGDPQADVTAQLAAQFAALLENPATSTTPTFAWVQLGEASIIAFTKANSSIKQCISLADLPHVGYGYLPPPKKPQITIECPDEDQMGFGVDFIDDMDPCFPQDDDDSIDPNSKTGPSGDRTKNHFIRPVSPFSYNVAFENEAKATLPAAQVVITDQLDPAKVNLSTLTLGAVQFGGHVISPPVGVNNFNTTYALNSTLNVRIEGSLDQTGGLLKWTFTSIDPSTGLPPTDPTVGFLPPDTDGVKGQGSVVFNVMPKSGQATGAKIANMASVIFDANAPIKTPTWVNTLDTTPPVSKVAALPALLAPKSGKATFKVSWSGSDVGSGIAFYNVYVADSYGTFKPLLMNTTLTSTTYTGKADHFYGFYSIATDNAGNVEPVKAEPDATTSIPPVKATAKLTSSAIKASIGTDVKFTVILSGPEPNDPKPTGTVTFFDGGKTLGKVTALAGKASISTKTLALGVHTITADYSGNTDYPKDASNTIKETIAKPLAVVKLTSSANPAKSGAKVSFTATLTGSKGVPTGTATFFLGETKKLDVVALSSGKATFTTESLPVGTDSITAVYSGNSNYAEGTSNAVKEKISQ
jgi:hypothetical protein